ncbi:MAG: histidinol-phosphate transaminase [Bacteroidota bacterium]
MNKKFNITHLVRNNVLEMSPYSSARDEYDEVSDNMVFLDANENPFDNQVNRYPDPKQNKLKQKLSQVNGIPSNQIVLGNGSDEVLDLIFRAFCEPKIDAIITLPPTYGMYAVLANLNDVKNIKIELDLDFQPKSSEILKAVKSNTKLLFICSPNNPTSNSFETKKIENLIKDFPGIVVIDEAYIDFSKNESWVTRLGEFPNLIVTQTMSKAYGMAGIRLGVCYASVEIVSILNRIKPPYNVNELTQLRAIKRLENRKEVIEEVEQILNQRDWLYKKLQGISFIEKVFPSDANFLLARVDDANLRYNQLIERGVVVRNRTNQPLCENCLRFTVGTEYENKKLIECLQLISKF